MQETQIKQPNPSCKYCHSCSVRKYGLVKGIQRYYCNECHRKFTAKGTIPKMQTSTRDIASALNMYYEGMSENDIRRNFIQQDKNYISTGSVYNWIDRFSELAEKEADKYHPKVGDTWIADETFMRIDRHKGEKSEVKNPYIKSRKAKWVVFWDIIDADTRFLLASVVTSTRNKEDARLLVEKAAERAGKIPKVVITDNLRAYIDGMELAFGSDSKHIQGGPFDVQNNTNLIERFHSTIKERTKVMRALKNRSTLKKFMDGWLVYYNFLRPHMALGDKTPAEAAGIKYPFHNWKEVVEQPYSVTARIPISDKPCKLSKSMPRITEKTPKLK